MRRPLRRPAPTVRLRLTLIYGIVFLVTGAVLLTIGYALVRHNLAERGDFQAVLRRLGLPVPPRALPPFPGFVQRFGPGSETFRAAAAYRAELRDSALHRLLAEYLLALGLMTAVSVGAGWAMAGRALRPLRSIIATARRVSGENLGERIALRGPADELRELADTFDGMLDRLEAAFVSQRDFVANASHELRTPLAVMRAEVDVALAEPGADPAELRRMGEGVREMVDRCERLIESLLTLARSEAAMGTAVDLDLAQLAGDVLTDMRARAQQSNVKFESALAPAPVHGDARLLERMLANVLDNAIIHGGPGVITVSTGVFSNGEAGARGTVLGAAVWAADEAGPPSARAAAAGAPRTGAATADAATIDAESHEGTGSQFARLIVESGGAVLDRQLVPRLTEPFMRAERTGEGFGLGLSIVHSVLAAYGGELKLDALPAGGLRVTATLPVGRELG